LQQQPRAACGRDHVWIITIIRPQIVGIIHYGRFAPKGSRTRVVIVLFWPSKNTIVVTPSCRWGPDCKWVVWTRSSAGCARADKRYGNGSPNSCVLMDATLVPLRAARHFDFCLSNTLKRLSTSGSHALTETGKYWTSKETPLNLSKREWTQDFKSECEG